MSFFLDSLLSIIPSYIYYSLAATASSIIYILLIQPPTHPAPMSHTISEKVLAWCTRTPSATDLLVADPSKTPDQVAKELFGRDPMLTDEKKGAAPSTPRNSSASSPESHASDLSSSPAETDLERALRCGKFGSTRPSELFLKMWYDAVATLEHDPLAGVVSPCLMGTVGAVPLSIIGSGWDICGHMANVIARAEKEVFFVTNFWTACGASEMVTSALRELNTRAGKRGVRVVVKMMYDRGR
jgi:hypothetical protein